MRQGKLATIWALALLPVALGQASELSGVAPSGSRQAERARAAANDVRGMAFDVYIRLQTGMSEAELLLRAGKPDQESVESVRHDIVKTYYYLPTSANPWLTAITLRGGRIFNLERNKKIF